MIVPCQEGRVPIVETEDLLQYATALRGPFECEDPDCLAIDPQNKSSGRHLEYLVCTETLDLANDRAVVHRHDLVSVERMARVLFSDGPSAQP